LEYSDEKQVHKGQFRHRHSMVDSAGFVPWVLISQDPVLFACFLEQDAELYLRLSNQYKYYSLAEKLTKNKNHT
jgi:hypothetical protein